MVDGSRPGEWVIPRCDALRRLTGRAFGTPVEMATSKTIAATIEKERDADDDQDRDEGLGSAAGLREEASTPRAFKKRRDARKAEKLGGGENP